MESLYREAIAIWKMVLLDDHPNVASGLNNLAEFVRTTGDYVAMSPHHGLVFRADNP